MLRERDREEASLTSQNVPIIPWTPEKSLKWDILEEHTCDKHKKGIILYVLKCMRFRAAYFLLILLQVLQKRNYISIIVILGAII